MANFVKSANPEHHVVNLDRVNRIDVKNEMEIYFFFSGKASGAEADDDDPVIEGRGGGSGSGGGKSKAKEGDYYVWRFETAEDAEDTLRWLEDEFFTSQPEVQPL